MHDGGKIKRCTDYDEEGSNATMTIHLGEMTLQYVHTTGVLLGRPLVFATGSSNLGVQFYGVSHAASVKMASPSRAKIRHH